MASLVVFGSTGASVFSFLFFLSLAAYLTLGTVLKSARPQPEFGLSCLALNAKPKSAGFLCGLARALTSPCEGYRNGPPVL